VKTQIIQLEPHDDTISVRDKMGWSQTGRVVLVWPARGRLLDRRLDLVLLLRHSQSLGVQIALVTADPEVRFQAHLLGISVYKSVRKAQNSRWKRPLRNKIPTALGQEEGQDRISKVHEILTDPLHRKRETPVLSPPIRIGLFTLGVLAVLSIAAILIPSADITISPETRRQEITLEVQASDTAERINLTGIFPIHMINTIVEGRGSIQTTGTVEIPTGFASGTAQFRNLTDQTVNIPAGTVVSTVDSAQRFTTQRDARVPAGPGKEIEISIKALSPGRSGNLPPGRITAIESDLGLFLTVENLASTRGGSLAQSPAPAAADRDQLKEELISTLTENALQEIQSSLDQKDILLDESPALINVLTESYYPPDLQPASQLELILRLEYETPYVSAADREAFAQAILDANLPAGYAPIPGTMMVEDLSSPRFTNRSTASWRMQLRRDIQSEPSIIQAGSLALGRSPENAAQLLEENLPLSSPPVIETHPSWWPLMPFIPLRITIIPSGTDQASNLSLPGILE
jgi:hypothetical protein